MADSKLSNNDKLFNMFMSSCATGNLDGVKEQFNELLEKGGTTHCIGNIGRYLAAVDDHKEVVDYLEQKLKEGN